TPTATPGTDDSEVWDLQFNAGGSSRDDMAAWGASTPAATVGTYTVSGTLSATPSAWLAVGFELLTADDGNSEVTGSLSATLDDATIHATGAVAVAGTVVATLDAAAVVAS